MRASEGTNPCTRPSFATKNVFDVLQDLSESIGGSPGQQLDAAAGSASTTQSPYMGQLLKTGLLSLFSALLVPFATFH